MKKAYMFPGQGSQFPGMGKDLYDNIPLAREMFEKADEILGFRITDVMFGDDAEALKATHVTQPAVFLHSVILAACYRDMDPEKLAAKGLAPYGPDMVAGHSLGEFSALTVAGAMKFEDALRLVSIRARAMQKCCDNVPGGMAAIIALSDEQVEDICSRTGGVVAANYNSKGQDVISGKKDQGQSPQAADFSGALVSVCPEHGCRRGWELPRNRTRRGAPGTCQENGRRRCGNNGDKFAVKRPDFPLFYVNLPYDYNQ